ncbi:tetratricopeptide repeat protein [Streptosporangium saharense]|uniref:tetratricopeptide repeat protein n=1 Tax=Streptosporangium saharense TaxID=1706840 RepID=UPI0036B2506B
MTSTDGVRNVIADGLFLAPVIQGRHIALHLPARVVPALAGLPAAAPSFTGRADSLRTLLDVLAPTPALSGAVLVAAVGGMGGIGKTELAVQAAHAALERGWFGGGVLFVDMFGYDPSRRLDADRAVEHFLRALAVPGEHIPADPHERLVLYRSVLNGYAAAGRPILVVIDNVSTSAQAVPLLPAHPACRAIVTSREHLARMEARVLDLDILDEGDAVALLQHALDVARPGDQRIATHPEEVRSLARLCGGLPLALQIAAALLAESPVLRITELITQLLPADRRLDELRYGDETITAIFDLSYQRLTAEQRALFVLLPLNPGPDISPGAAAALTGQDQADARRTLTELARTHLVEPAPGQQRWRMHDLIRLYAARKPVPDDLPIGRDEALTNLFGHYRNLVEQAALHFHAPTATAPSRFSDRDSAVQWLDAEMANLVAAVQHCATSTFHEHRLLARDLPITLAAYLGWSRRFTDWVTLATVCLRTAEHLEDQHGEGEALNNLGAALQGMRRFEEAAAVHTRAARTFRETGDRHGEGQALNNLGAALQGMRRFKEAVTAHTEAVRIHRGACDQHGEGQALNNLGAALQETRRFEEAVAVHTQTVRIFQQTGNKNGEGAALNNLGAALQETHRFGEAVAAHTRAVRAFQEVGNKHGEGQALNNLGSALQGMRRFEEAVAAHTQAAQTFRETGNRYGEGEAMSNLGHALRGKRRYIKAFRASRQARWLLHGPM